jgi:ABC-2 type transport system ATP-binding protein
VAAGARLRDTGVTIILTTHYIEEAEEMADRIGVINKGELILVEEKAELMRKLGKQAAHAAAAAAAARCRRAAAAGSSWRPTARADLHLRHAGRAHRHRRRCCEDSAPPASLQDLHTTQSSLEDIFVGLVKDGAA